MKNKHYPDEFTNYKTGDRELMCNCGGPWPCAHFKPGLQVKTMHKNGLTNKEIREKLDNIAFLVLDLEREAKRRYGKDGALYYEAGGRFYMMSGDSDKGARSRQENIVESSSVSCTMDCGGW